MTVSPATIHEFKPRRPDPIGETGVRHPYPIHALGDVLGPAANAIATSVQCAPETAAHSVLSAATLAAQALANVEIPYERRAAIKPCSLFFATVCASGERKSAADSEAMAPVRMREAELREIYDARLPGYQNSKEAWEAARRKAQNKKGADYESIKAALDEIGPAPVPPLAPFLTVGDLTIEGLYRAFEHAHPALGVFTDEGGQVVAGHAMNKDNRAKTSTALSKLWDGGGVQRLRAGDGASLFYGRRVSIHLMFQPDLARQFLSDAALVDQGLIGRFLVAEPERKAGSRFYREDVPSFEQEMQRYTTRVLLLLEKNRHLKTGTHNELDPPALTFTSEAETMFREFADATERENGPNGHFFCVQSLSSKMPEHVARLACVLQLVESPDSAAISPSTMADAIALGGWYLAEAVRLWEASHVSKVEADARTLLDWIQSHHVPRRGEVVTLTDMNKGGPHRLRGKRQLTPLIKMLVSTGHLLSVENHDRTWRIVNSGGADAA